MGKPLVVIVPGVMGSRLEGLWGGVLWRKIWLSIPTLAANLPALAVAPDGVSPREDSLMTAVRPAGLLAEYYGILHRYLQLLGYDVLPFGYDWRLSVQSSGQALAQVLRQQYPGRDIIFVAHSLGGIVARAAWKYLAAAGDDRVVRLITLGTPHRGSVSIPNLFGHLDPTYSLLVELVGGPFFSRGTSSAIVDSVIASLVSIYEMGPFRGRFTPAVDGAIRDRANYARFNPYLIGDRFASADGVQAWLADAGDPARTVCVVGLGLPTANDILDPTRLDQKAGYGYGDGDGRVEAASAALSGALLLTVSGVGHHQMPYAPNILYMLPSLIGGAFLLQRIA